MYPLHLNVPYLTVPCYPSLECRPFILSHWIFIVQSHKLPVLFMSGQEDGGHLTDDASDAGSFLSCLFTVDGIVLIFN